MSDVGDFGDFDDFDDFDDLEPYEHESNTNGLVGDTLASPDHNNEYLGGLDIGVEQDTVGEDSDPRHALRQSPRPDPSTQATSSSTTSRLPTSSVSTITAKSFTHRACARCAKSGRTCAPTEPERVFQACDHCRASKLSCTRCSSAWWAIDVDKFWSAYRRLDTLYARYSKDNSDPSIQVRDTIKTSLMELVTICAINRGLVYHARADDKRSLNRWFTSKNWAKV